MITKHTVTTASFTVPAKGSSVSIPVANASWITVDDFVHVRNGGNFVVVGKTANTVTLVYYGPTEFEVVGTVIHSGASVTEGARPAVPEPTDPSKASPTQLAAGGTGAATPEGARANLGIQTIQTGTATLVLGTVTVTTANIGTGSKVFITRTAAPGGVAAGEIGLAVLGVVTGSPGSFSVTAIDKDGNTVTADVATVNWMVVG